MIKKYNQVPSKSKIYIWERRDVKRNFRVQLVRNWIPKGIRGQICCFSIVIRKSISIRKIIKFQFLLFAFVSCFQCSYFSRFIQIEHIPLRFHSHFSNSSAGNYGFFSLSLEGIFINSDLGAFFT